MAHITISNSKKMIRKLDALTLDSIAEEIFERDIYFFSKRERANLKGIRELFRDPERFGLDYYKPIEVKDSKKYVFPERQPSYHRDRTCQRLHSNYKNFEIPVAVRERGDAGVEAFRIWFTQNNCHNLTATEYIQALQLKFPYVGGINPRSIELDNTGNVTQENYSLEGLLTKINQILDECDKYFEDNKAIRNLIVRYQKWTFLAFTYGTIKDNNSGLSDEQLRDFLYKYELTFKTPVKSLLVEYYRIRFNPELEFEGKLLEKMGFSQCRHCLT
ncbi:hypothetical protein [Pseudocnuella soli]|uniref:hypothetical protein n=1 Tax=Pseudocnuella soli TaxID=2502779 RepID=UPI00104FA193|nr:hypothetical protein [Pseudocnuella soli]